MWPVTILTAFVVMGTNCYQEKIAVGYLPNKNYVIITSKVNLMFTDVKLRGNHYLLRSDEKKLYAIQVHSTTKKTFGFIIFLLELDETEQRLQAKKDGLKMIISTTNNCDDVKTSPHLRHSFSTFEAKFRER